jgi:branched-chain amino acid transport system ATP-binding protein
MNAEGVRPCLELSGVSVNFGGISALDNVSFEVLPAQVFGLLGPNGAGKTTLFNVIAGAIVPNAGRTLLNGEDVTAWSPNRLCRAGIARTFQITQPFQALTVEENVMVPLCGKGFSLSQMRAQVGEYIEGVGLGHKRFAFASELSTGQRKRLELARALATRPKVVLLDEVTGGVDMASIGGLLDLVQKLPGMGVAVVIVEHNMSVIRRLADSLLFLNRGKVLARGKPDEVLGHKDVVELYLGAANA